MDSEKEKNSCQICGKTFSTASNRDIHMRTHTRVKPCSCEICGKSFTTAQNNDTHMKTHTGEKPYSCGICGKSFSQSSSKDLHMRTHTGEKPYSCTICGKSFITAQNKERHVRTHTKEKPYSCQICEKSFTTAQGKDYHMRTHIGKKPYSCDVCGKSFTTSNYRDKHEKGHNDKYIHLQPSIKPVCVMIKKLSSLQIKELSEKYIKNNDNFTNISDNNIDNPMLKEDDTTLISQEVFIKEDGTSNISQVKNENTEIEVEEEDLVKKYWEEFTSDLPQTNDCFSIKEEPAFIDKADADVNVKEEETGDYLYDSDNIDHSEVYKNMNEIDIEDFKLEEPDV